ncbi:putative polyprenol reductase NDAI_0A02580 [Naumovozyma dairenensis CBS 421]|uniref:Polyprenal reductase n=1 Tax=Naumovozyma dairenensis (strain ATCC 10597 / BCRC 20456 / CBS 421 / NBRC 0211 / NRRL Y-12639) TaxID=1071378 RepID=G0W3M8_NAUDC|nr:hypothetical protein NDAI_0A02580 [Naumovozyma dairenensis CBS 421]CCD22416.1 hypothetical protein NDAI_0A02580 [Naumovozyma dairenensis CBS 421]
MEIDPLLQLVTYLYRISFFIGFLSVIVAKLYLPDFLEYGKTLKDHDEPQNKTILQKIIHFTVPKAYFSHFYYLSSVLSLVTFCYYPSYPIVWMLLFHSLRRLYETLYTSKYSAKSRMNWSHYVVGIWFYSTLHIILGIKLHYQEIPRYPRDTFTFLIFFLASWDQYKNHEVLANLVKYSLPKERLFKLVSCPHYLDELIIYGSFIAFNNEFCWLFVWVFVSLGISALETKAFYQLKFKDEVVPKYAMVPFIL